MTRHIERSVGGLNNSCMEGRALKLALRSSKEGVCFHCAGNLVAEQMIHNSEVE